MHAARSDGVLEQVRLSGCVPPSGGRCVPLNAGDTVWGADDHIVAAPIRQAVHPVVVGAQEMIIPTIDSGLEAMLRQGLPLPETVGDISFEPPSGTWSAQLNRITVNLFLFGVGRSSQPPRPSTDRVVDGRAQRRHPIPMLELHYLVSAWAGVVRDEHQLLGDALGCVLNNQVLTEEQLGNKTTAGVQLMIAAYDNTRAKDVWATVGGAIKPSFELIATTAGDPTPFVDLAPRVERISALVAPQPNRGG